jgi:adenylate cyclase
MRFCVLGPLEVYEDGRAVKVGGGRQRGLLALLLVHAGEIVSRDRLIDELWSGAPPAAASQSLDSYLSRLRRALREAGAEGVLATRAPGYVLHAEETDAARFEATVRAGQGALAGGDCARAGAVLREALAMWRGAAYVEVAHETWARPEAERLEELRLEAIEDRIEADLALGRHAALVAELELLAARHRTRERLAGQLMLALYRAGRQADALSVYRAAREALVEDLGLEPGPELRRLQASVLAQDPGLDLPGAETVAAGGVTVGPERKQVTVLCADLIGRTELAERERVLSVVRAGVHRLEGTMDHSTGDGIMAVFGAPIAHEDHARRACYAALHLRHELANHSLRIGLSSGEVEVEEVRPDLSMRYTAIGETVALARRMMGLAGPDSVYLAGPTASLVEGYFVLEDVGGAAVELIGAGSGRGALDVARERGFSRFVGRSDELRGLLDALDRAVAGKGRVIGVVGEPGVGKSRLCHEFTELVRAQELPVFRVAGQPHTKSVPLLPVLEYLRGYFEIGERDPAWAARQRITGRLAALDERLLDELSLLFEFLGVPDPDRRGEQMDPEARQRRLLSFLRRLTHAQGARELVVTLIEDLHWLDPASEVFLANHIDAIQGVRALTVVNFRPEYRAEWMARSYYHQIALEPLRPAAALEMIDALLGDDASVAGLEELVRERAQGNPFFIEELVRSLVESGSLVGERGGYRLVRQPDWTAVPANVQAVIAARIDRLPPREKHALQAAAVIGKEFPQPVLARVIELGASEVDDALRTLTAAELVYEQVIDPEPVLTFSHPLTREVAYRSLTAHHRRVVHAAVARAVASHYPDRLDERAALLAQHWESAGEMLEAAGWHARAAEWAGSSAPAEAVGHWRKVRDLADALPDSAQSEAHRLQARVALLNYGWRLGVSHDDPAALFAEAERMAARSGDIHAGAILHILYGAVRGMGYGDVRDYVQLARQALALAAKSGDPALHVGVVSGAAHALHSGGHYREAVAAVDRALDLADGDPTLGRGLVMACPYAECQNLKAWALAELGDLEQARRLLDGSRELARQQDDIETVGYNHQMTARVAHFQGEAEVARTHARAAVEIAERMGNSVGRAHSWCYLGLAEQMRGEWRNALEALERSAAISEERGLAVDIDPERRALLGETRLALGDREQARALAEQGVKMAHAQGQVFNEEQTNLALARVLLSAEGISARADIEAALTRALELAQETGARTTEARARLELAELARLGDDQEGHARELTLARDLFVAIGATGHAQRLSTQMAAPVR